MFGDGPGSISIVTVVDARHVVRRLEDSHEALEQIAFADVILLNKTDLVPADELAQVETRIRSINATAVIHRTQRCQVGLDTVLGRRAFDLDRILAIEPDFLSEDDHEHDDAVKSVCLRTDRPLDGTRLTGVVAAPTCRAWSRLSANQRDPIDRRSGQAVCRPGGPIC